MIRPKRSATPAKTKRFGDAIVASIAKEHYLWIRGVRSERLLKAINAAYAEKYTTPASIQYVKGFARGNVSQLPPS